MGILATTKARFLHSEAQTIHCVKVSDPLHDEFMQASFNLLRGLNGNEPDQVHLRVKVTGLFYRVSTFINDDFCNDGFVEYCEKELEELTSLASQFEAVEYFARTIAKTLSFIIERGTNYKRKAIEQYLISSSADSSMTLIERGHKWRTLDLHIKKKPFKALTSLSFDFQNFQPIDTALVPMSPNLLSKKLLKELFFGGGAEALVIFLYRKEKLRLPEIPLFIASSESDDSPLIPPPKISFNDYKSEDVISGLVTGDELELVVEDYTTGTDRVFKLLLVTNEELLVRPWDYVWCDDQGYLSHIPATELVEGMRLLLRAEHHLEKPEEYLDRSEVWRTPLRSTFNLGISFDSLARNIEHRAGIAVNSRMVRSWMDGSVLGPEERGVFMQLVEELKLRDFMGNSVSGDEVDVWWEDLEKARLAQTSKGVKNRSQALKEAERVLSDEQDLCVSNGSLFEYSEILVIDRTWIGFDQSELLGISNHRNMRIFS